MRVDLPAPFRPTTATVSPGAIRRLTLLNASWPDPGYVNVTPSKTTSPRLSDGGAVRTGAPALDGAGDAASIPYGVFRRSNRSFRKSWFSYIDPNPPSKPWTEPWTDDAACVYSVRSPSVSRPAIA